MTSLPHRNWLRRIHDRVDFRSILDVLLVGGSFWIAVFLSGGLYFIERYSVPLFACCGLTLFFRLGVLYAMGANHIIWRYITAQDAFRLVMAMVFSTILISAGFYFVRLQVLGPTILILDLLVSTYLVTGSRLLWRAWHEYRKRMTSGEGGRKTIIYGAGTHGVQLAHRIKTDPHLSLRLIGFVDDDPRKQGKSIGGVRVLGTREHLRDFLIGYQVKALVIAIADLEGPALRDVLQQCHRCGVRPKMYLSFGSATITDKSEWELLRDVQLRDLLKRSRKKIDLIPLQEELAGKRVMITGGGGSIGGELARQLLGLNPSEVIVLDHSEYSLYQITEELLGLRSTNLLITPVLADLKDIASVKLVMNKYRPQVVFHAAAYKHVHLVEANPQASVLNNVLGTKNLLDVCADTDVETFVLISTDKAVNPVGIMGATKRVCELMTSTVAKRTGKRYCTVRFGNVLLSSGSLVPLLKKQIRNGGPVTITHKDMTRYFMLLPEAASLVLKASSISAPGDLNILKMGEPIKIVDIATSLITLLGKNPDEVPIIYTGARPGEKLAEELYLCGDELKTVCEEILVLPNGDLEANKGALDPRNVNRRIEKLVKMAQEGSPETAREVLELAQEHSRVRGRPVANNLEAA